jgi:hypothetical protein
MIKENNYKESPTIVEIKSFFKEAEKVPYGEVLASISQDFTGADGQEMNGSELVGKIGYEGDSPWMVLANLRGVKEIRLEIFSKRKDIDIISGDLVFIAGKTSQRVIDTPVDGIAYNFKSDTRVLSDKYNRLLIKIASEVSSRYLESRKGSESAGDGGGASHH